VGAVAGQLARAGGVGVVAIVGNRAKANDAKGLGYDEAVVRTEADWQAQLAAACPEGVDAYLHMGDGPTLNGVLGRLALGARVSLCGLMTPAGDSASVTLPAGAIMRARAAVHGMVVYDHADLAAEARTRIGELLRSAVMVLHEERHDGLELAPAAFVRLLAGHNRGKVVVSVGGTDQAR
jgi:NADPH-dependent curcumin reductase CurA